MRRWRFRAEYVPIRGAELTEDDQFFHGIARLREALEDRDPHVGGLPVRITVDFEIEADSGEHAWIDGLEIATNAMYEAALFPNHLLEPGAGSVSPDG